VSIIKAFKTALKKKEQNNWDRLYVFVDLHETIIVPSYKDAKRKDAYPYALEVLRYLKHRSDICLVLYTCSRQEHIAEYLKWFSEHDITFEFVNSSPEPNSKYADFSQKPYFNVLLDDKAGFDPEEDWLLIKNYFGYNEFLQNKSS
jgi:hypothetical protein